MSETMHLKNCPICQSGISITHDKIEDSLTLRPENIPPLAKDCLTVVAQYKRLKGLGADWQRSHGARGIVYAHALLTAVGVAGGQMERALGLLEWLQTSGKDFDLGSAPTFLGSFQTAKKAKEQASAHQCRLCLGPDETKTGLCEGHQFCWTCRSEVKPPYNWYREYAHCGPCLEAIK